MIYAKKTASGWRLPLDLPRTFNGIAGFDRLTDPELAQHNWFPVALQDFEFDPVTSARTPHPVEIEFDGVKVIAKYAIRQRPLDELRDFALSKLASKRYEIETRGLRLGDLQIATDDRSKSLLAAKALRVAQSRGEPVSWKTPTGWVTLAPEQIIALNAAVDAYVQACFEREAELAVLITESDTPHLVDIDSGWPEPIDSAQALAAAKRQTAIQSAQSLVLKEQIAAKIETMPDEDKATFAYLYDEWAVGQAYAIGDIVRVGDAPYRVLQAHTSQADWTPDTAASLFTPLRNTGQGGGAPDDWVQPTGAHDSYSIGDRVTFNGAVYESLINGNAHSPSAYPAGWQLVE